MFPVRCSVLANMIAIAAALLSVTGSGQSYPNKPIRMLVALSAGSQSDILARMIAPKMSENWRQPVDPEEAFTATTISVR